ncbi:uncharacterized protein LOC120262821 isoform X2 [Dioscorea cayenensis subsp. rotundata]|uniref:Uncharacterized protein LOC120262821 isoform X2 n=1 Tax=Dioscorea cayennensis subsp. rotundata TaxID=55577 RepID=A0AB40BHC4_DIOCR|nr:uncharacterized protein LOC120262821 isoform X2 [Dioscorea cayenensis subsp. rotundata]
MPSGKLSEICKSERLRNQPKRKPFSDLTNGLAPAFGSFPSSIPDVTSTKPPASVISNAAKNKKVQNLWPTSTLRGIPSDLDLVKDQTCSTPHAQQRPTEKDYKGKSLAVASSSDCTQLGRTSSMRLKLESARVDHCQAKSFSVPLGKFKKKPRIRVPEAIKKPVLPQDFVEKQKAYFAEIDAFELPEEVVLENELE